MYCSMIYTIHRHVINLDEYSLRINIEYSNYNRRQLVILYAKTIIEMSFVFTVFRKRTDYFHFF